MKFIFGLLTIVLFLFSDAKAKNHSIKSVRNFLVEQSINVRQLGLSGLLACSIAVTGCGAKKIDGKYYFYDERQVFVENHRHHRSQPKRNYRMLPDPFLFAKAPLAPIVWAIKGYPNTKRSKTDHLHSIQGGMIWHVGKDTSGAYTFSGNTYRYFKGLYATRSDSKKYRDRAPFFTSSDYHEVQVIYNKDGVFRRGLAVSKLGSDNQVYVVFPFSDEFDLINIDEIVGTSYIYAMNYKKNYHIAEFTKKDILPFSFDKDHPIDPSELGFEDGVLYWGHPVTVYSNATSLIRVPSLKTTVLIKDGVFFYQ